MIPLVLFRLRTLALLSALSRSRSLSFALPCSLSLSFALVRSLSLSLLSFALLRSLSLSCALFRSLSLSFCLLRSLPLSFAVFRSLSLSFALFRYLLFSFVFVGCLSLSFVFVCSSSLFFALFFSFALSFGFFRSLCCSFAAGWFRASPLSAGPWGFTLPIRCPDAPAPKLPRAPGPGPLLPPLTSDLEDLDDLSDTDEGARDIAGHPDTCKLGSLCHIFPSIGRLRLATWNCRTRFPSMGYPHDRYAATIRIADSLIDSHDVIALQETHGSQVDLDEMSSQHGDFQFFGTFCDGGAEGGLVMAARKSLILMFDMVQLRQIVPGRIAILELSNADGYSLRFVGVHLQPEWTPRRKINELRRCVHRNEERRVADFWMGDFNFVHSDEPRINMLTGEVVRSADNAGKLFETEFPFLTELWQPASLVSADRRPVRA